MYNYKNIIVRKNDQLIFTMCFTHSKCEILTLRLLHSPLNYLTLSYATQVSVRCPSSSYKSEATSWSCCRHSKTPKIQEARQKQSNTERTMGILRFLHAMSFEFRSYGNCYLTIDPSTSQVLDKLLLQYFPIV